MTAAILSVLSVTAVGALLGLKGGVVAGLAASILYNLLFTDPYFKFSVASADDLVPILAMNVSAVASGLIAGRLHDRAILAESSSRRIAELLQFSQDVQRAITIEEIERVLQSFLDETKITARVSLQGRDSLSKYVQQVKEVKERRATHGSETTFLLESGDSVVGQLVLEHDETGLVEDWVRPLLPIVAMATQRCRFAAEAAEADLLRQSETFKTALLSSVSHDLRTPLAAISASASSLESLGPRLDDDVRKDLLRTIQEQCGRLDRLTGKLLSLGRIDGGLDAKRMPIVDAVEVLGSALARVRSTFPSHRFERDFTTADANVRADEPLLEQLFINVLENAVVHTPANTRVRVSTTRANQSLTVSIEDNGPGISPQDRDRIFDRFFQGRSKVGSGSGLGLSIARGFCEAIGGTIHAGSAVQATHGTRIDISLPLAGPS